MIIKLILDPDDIRNPGARELMKSVESMAKIEELDVSDPDGLAEALFYDSSKTPGIIVIGHDNEIIASWSGRIPAGEELRKILEP